MTSDSKSFKGSITKPPVALAETCSQLTDAGGILRLDLFYQEIRPHDLGIKFTALICLNHTHIPSTGKGLSN